MRRKSKAGRKFLQRVKSLTSGRSVEVADEQEDIDDIALEEEDLELLAEFGQSAGFLTSIREDDLKKYLVASHARNPENLKLPRIPRDKVDEQADVEMVDLEIIDRAIDESDDDGFEDVSDAEDSQSMNSSAEALSDLEESLSEIEPELIHPTPKRQKTRESPDYEASSLSSSKKWMVEPAAPRLPIKDDAGILHKVNAPLIVDRVAGDELEYQKERAARQSRKETNLKNKKGQHLIPNPQEPLLKVELYQDLSLLNPKDDSLKPKSKREKQERIAELSSLICENPEKHSLREFLTDSSTTIKTLAFLSQLAVYTDIIPGYRIRKLTEKELKLPVSKDVKILRQYEEALLSNYQAYLQSIEQATKACKNYESYQPLMAVLVECLAELVTKVPHFNFRINILTALVERMGSKRNPQILSICCNAISNLFKQDESGEASLEAVKLISRMIKAKVFNVPEEALGTFLHLRLRSELASHLEKKKGVAKKKVPLSKAIKKVYKEFKEITSELKEAEAVVDREERAKVHTETLKLVFVTYFRILKNSKTSPLLSAVLEGLAKFAHLINVDFFQDLLTSLKNISFEQMNHFLAESTEIKLSKCFTDSRSAFHSIVASFQLLSGQGEALNIDLKDFSLSLYTQLLRLPCMPAYEHSHKFSDMQEALLKGSASLVYCKDEGRKTAFELAIQAVDLMLIKRKEVSLDRVCSFLKRLCSIALHLTTESAYTCLTVARALFMKYPKLKNLLDSDECIGTGVYEPELNDPDLCNPFATSLWELGALAMHYDEKVRNLAGRLAAGDFSNN